jgi:malate permease and related proteins
MSLLLGILVNDILPVFAVASVGFVLGRRLHLDVRSLSRISFDVLSPCLVFTSLVTTDLAFDEFGRIVAFTVLLVLCSGLIAVLVARPFRLDGPALAAFLMVVMFSNSGNYGLSAVLFAFGPPVLARAVVYFVTSSLLTYTVGPVLALSGRIGIRAALRGLLKVPVLWGLLVAIVVKFAGVSVPTPLLRPIELLSVTAIPIMLLVLGMQFERGARPERPGLVAAAAAVALVMSPVLGFALAKLLALGTAARQAMIVEASMPSAVITTILALEFDVAPKFVTSVVVVTTLASPLTVSLVIALLQSGF